MSGLSSPALFVEQAKKKKTRFGAARNASEKAHTAFARR